MKIKFDVFLLNFCLTIEELKNKHNFFFTSIVVRHLSDFPKKNRPKNAYNTQQLSSNMRHSFFTTEKIDKNIFFEITAFLLSFYHYIHIQ